MKRLEPKLVVKGFIYLGILILMNYVIRWDLSFDYFMSEWSIKIMVIVMIILVLAVFFKKKYLVRLISFAYFSGYFLGKGVAWLIRGPAGPDEKHLLMAWMVVLLLAMFLAGKLDHPHLRFLAKVPEEEEEI